MGVRSSTLTYSAAGLPGGLSIDPASGAITGTLSDSAFQATPYQVVLTATDGTSSASQTFAWTVTPVRLVNPGIQAVMVGDTGSLAVSAHDMTGATLTYSATGLPDGLTIDPATGIISGTFGPNSASQDPYDVTLTATDGTNSATRHFAWFVVPTTFVPSDPTAPARDSCPHCRDVESVCRDRGCRYGRCGRRDVHRRSR